MIKKFRKAIILGSLFAMALGFIPSFLYAEDSGFGVSLGPSLIRLSGAPGESAQESIRVYNRSSYPMSFEVTINDIGNRVEEDGKLVRSYYPPGTLPHSCSKWILLKENTFIVQPGEYKDVEVLVSAPLEDVTGVRASVVFFVGSPVRDLQASDDSQDQVTASVQILPRLGVLTFFDVAGTLNRTGILDDFTLKVADDGSGIVMDYVFENTGNADILVTGSFYILDENKALVAKDNITSIRTFPGDRGASQTSWDGILLSGNYQLIATFELGPDTESVIVRETNFSV